MSAYDKIQSDDKKAFSILGIGRTEGLVFLGALAAIYYTTYIYNYILFHSISELFSIIVSVTIFLITINNWDLIDNRYMRFVGISCFFVSVMDILHTLSYTGMPIFTDYKYYAPQFWVAARLMESVSMLAGFLAMESNFLIRMRYLLPIYSAITIAVVLSILVYKTFPVCFVPGKGLSDFKIYIEYVICGVDALAFIVLRTKNTRFSKNIINQLSAALIVMILSELCFTDYHSILMNDFANKLGHLLKIFYFYLIYKAVIVTALRDPTEMLFKNLKRNEQRLSEAQGIAHLGAWEWDLRVNQWQWSPQLCSILNIAPTDKPSLDRLLTALPADQGPALRERFRHAAATGEGFTSLLRLSDDPAPPGRPARVELRCQFVANPQERATLLHGTIQDVTEQQRLIEELAERKLSEERIRISEERFRSTFEQAAMGIIHTDFDGRFLRCNERFSQIVGYTCDELLSMRFQDITPDEDVEESRRSVEALRDGTVENASIVKRYRRKDGTLVWVHLTTSVQRDAEGLRLHLITLVEDITVKKQAEDDLKLAALVYETSNEAMVVTDPEGRILTVNSAFSDVTGYSKTEVIGKSMNILRSGKHSNDFYLRFWNDLASKGMWKGEIWNRRKSGEIFPEVLSVNTVFSEDGVPLKRIGLFSDITKEKEFLETIWQQANFDPLTGLPNRRMFTEHLAKEIETSRRGGRPFAVMFLDLDNFKEVNDALGHGVGDLLLCESSKRLTSCLRKIDLVSRLGGDEFTVILSDLADLSGIDRIAGNILVKLSEPYVLGGETSYVSASIGITLFPDDAATVDGLLKNADQAMYEAKRLGRNRFNYFKPEMQKEALKRADLALELRTALAESQFRLFYQPIVDLETGAVTKAEALIRWFHPAKGVIGPGEFIPIAEKNGLIDPIGNWAFREAADQTAAWLRRFGRSIQISVNKSPVQFHQKTSSSDEWNAYLAGHGLRGSSIIIEITEGLFLDASADIYLELDKFQKLGFQISLDDFGTGYSSLSYLKNFNINFVKIDKAFVQGIAPNSSDMALCEAIIVMAHKLGMKVIAEGIELESQRDLLLAAQCDFGQGYLFAKPLPAAEFERLFLTNTPVPTGTVLR
jgi:diguanylate cyclase (GGDEF)-like protein/PAS domain S-box-containing protein